MGGGGGEGYYKLPKFIKGFNKLFEKGSKLCSGIYYLAVEFKVYLIECRPYMGDCFKRVDWIF